MGCATHPSAPPVCTGPASSCRRNSATAHGLPASAQSWPPLRLWMELIALLLVLFKANKLANVSYATASSNVGYTPHGTKYQKQPKNPLVCRRAAWEGALLARRV
ncbi:hypothetical protein AAFF_G00017190 [Aldrovandia affinis]|uniref:Uncharacterized protein n=1 Tax=Aldrovandia affinis TaxID=143900 RepID=A0AAD7R2I1_9TELE|nr:hypothetical protein AAFF_G00017190 [Aldrovandia affinis]